MSKQDLRLTASDGCEPVRPIHSNQIVVTFSVGGALRNYYALLHVRDDENDGETADNVIRLWLKEHFPKEWASTYPLNGGGKALIREYHLRPVFCGRIEYFDGKTFFHEEVCA